MALSFHSDRLITFTQLSLSIPPIELLIHLSLVTIRIEFVTHDAIDTSY
jgi:hypothetical protein